MMEEVLQKYLQRPLEIKTAVDTHYALAPASIAVLSDKYPDRTADKDAVKLLAEMVAKIRPEKVTDATYAVHTVQALCHLLNRNAQYAELVRDAILHLLGRRKPVSLYVDSGIQPSSGFFR